MSGALRLRETQRWFLGEIEAATAAPRQRRRRGPRADEVIAPSATLAPSDRVAIYGRMYMARLVEALENDFPVLVAVLGHARFHSLVRRYATHRRPSSWTLCDFGAGLPEFVAREAGLPRAALARDVARIERAMCESFDSEVERVLRPADVAALSSDQWAGTRLVASPSLRLVALETDANRVVTRVREGGEPPRTSIARPSWVAGYRRDDRVWRLDLTRPMHAALAALVRGRTIGEAVNAARRVFRGDDDVLVRHVRAWFAQWTAEELFAGLTR